MRDSNRSTPLIRRLTMKSTDSASSASVSVSLTRRGLEAGAAIGTSLIESAKRTRPPVAPAAPAGAPDNEAKASAARPREIALSIDRASIPAGMEGVRLKGWIVEQKGWTAGLTCIPAQHRRARDHASSHNKDGLPWSTPGFAHFKRPSEADGPAVPAGPSRM